MVEKVLVATDQGFPLTKHQILVQVGKLAKKVNMQIQFKKPGNSSMVPTDQPEGCGGAAKPMYENDESCGGGEPFPGHGDTY